MNTGSEEIRLSPTLLLLSDDETLAELVSGIVKRPWKLVRQDADRHMSRKLFTQPNVRLVILDDQAVEESDRNWLLAQVRKHFAGASLLYVAGSQSDANERRARTNGAHYYASKPLSLERFSRVLRSFLQVQQIKGQPMDRTKEQPAMSAKDSTTESLNPIGAGIRGLSDELNREDSQLRSCLFDAALAGLRLARSPESRELRRDAARIWATIQPILSHHLEAEDGQLLPWLEQQGGLSPGAGRKVLECHGKLRTLIGAIAGAAGPDRMTEAQAREVGRALSGLAVYLDDAIDDEERRLFPTIQKALFGINHRS